MARYSSGQLNLEGKRVSVELVFRSDGSEIVEAGYGSLLLGSNFV